MSDEKRARLKRWLESGEARLHPLTFPQRELWESSPASPGDVSNHICCLIHAQGQLGEGDSEKAVKLVVQRQEALRVSFLPGKDRTLQMVRRDGDANIRFRDLATSEQSPEAIEGIASEIFAQPFDLVQGPLFRVEVLRLRADAQVIVLSIHHAIADGWSLGVFVQDLAGAYLQTKLRMRDPLPDVPVTYSQWDAIERAFWTPTELDRCATYWKPKLQGTQRLWESPDAGTIERWTSSLSPDLANAARATAKRSGVTLFSTLLTAFQITLARFTGKSDILVGTPVANRSRPNVQETMGYFAGVVPLRGQVDLQRPFRDSVRRVQEETTEAFSYAMPFAELAKAVGEQATAGYNPIYQVRFALQNHPIPDVAVPGLSAQLRMRSTGTPRLDLGCEVTEAGEGCEVVWLFRNKLFSESDVRELQRLFQVELENACASPESLLASVNS